MEILKTVTEYYIVPRESGEHVDAGEKYWLFTQVNDAPFTEEQLEILKEYSATGKAEVQTSMHRTDYVKGDLIMEVTRTIRAIDYDSLENLVSTITYHEEIKKDWKTK